MLAALCLLTVSVRAQDYTFLCDSNGVARPGFYFPWSNLVGSASTTQLPTNVILLAQLQLATNTVMTNAASANSSTSNALTTRINLMQGAGNVNLGTNTVTLGGSSNILTLTSPAIDGGFILGGKTNTLYGYSVGNGIVGGQYNRIDYGSFGLIAGGLQNYLSLAQSAAVIAGQYNMVSAPFSIVLGGISNVVFDASNSVITAGVGNTIGQISGWRGIYDGPFAAPNSVAAGCGAWPVHSSSWVWADYQGPTNYLRTTGTNQFLIRARGGVGINTNNPGTNALAVLGNADFSSASIGGTNLFTLFSWITVSNNLSILWNYNFNAVSNGLQAVDLANSNATLNASNTLATRIVDTNTLLMAKITALSNQFAASVSPAKAFTATVPATYASIGIGFSTPLMPDGNYSVALTPQDAATAGSPSADLYWYVGSKNSSGFTIYLSYATNGYNLNFDCVVKENSQ